MRTFTVTFPEKFSSEQEARDFQLELIYNKIRSQLVPANIVTNSAVGQLFDRQLHEFVKNSVDAKATQMTFTLSVTEGSAHITIADNGTTTIPEGKLGKYNWRATVLEKSDKAESGQLGGCNLGLATAANFLETMSEGELQLTQGPEGGAVITLTSSIKPCDIDRFSFANYVLEIIHDLVKAGCEGPKLVALKEKYHYPEDFVSKRDKLKDPAPTPSSSQCLSSPNVVLTPVSSASFASPVTAEGVRRSKRPPPLFQFASPVMNSSGASASTDAGLSFVSNGPEKTASPNQKNFSF